MSVADVICGNKQNRVGSRAQWSLGERVNLNFIIFSRIDLQRIQLPEVWQRSGLPFQCLGQYRAQLDIQVVFVEIHLICRFAYTLSASHGVYMGLYV